MTILRVGVASYEEMKARTMAMARGEPARRTRTGANGRITRLPAQHERLPSRTAPARCRQLTEQLQLCNHARFCRGPSSGVADPLLLAIALAVLRMPVPVLAPVPRMPLAPRALSTRLMVAVVRIGAPLDSLPATSAFPLARRLATEPLAAELAGAADIAPGRLHIAAPHGYTLARTVPPRRRERYQR